MVKTPFGRHPGPKRANIAKKLRRRRRMAERELRDTERELRDAAQTEIVDTFSCEVTTVRTSPPPSDLDQQCQPMNAIKASSPGVSTAELPEPHGARDQTTPPEMSDVSSTSSSEDKEEAPGLLLFERDQRIPGLTICVHCRQPSEATNGNSNDHDGRRQSVSESNVHKPPSRLAVTFIAESERLQHADEDTDRYLAHHFAPSLLNITTADEPTQDTRSDDFVKLRNLLSSDTQVTASNKSADHSTIESDDVAGPSVSHPRTVYFAKFEDILSSDASETTMVMNSRSHFTTSSTHQSESETDVYGKVLPTLFSDDTSTDTGAVSLKYYRALKSETALRLSDQEPAIVSGLPPALSDAALGLNTMSTNKSTAERAGTSCETTSIGLRTLFDEKDGHHQNVKSSASTFGLNTLFNPALGTDDTASTSTTTLPHLTYPCATTISCGSSSNPQKSCRFCSLSNKSAADMPAVTASSSLLGNFFASSSAVHDDGHLLTEKERKKAMIAKDLAAYLNSDDERTHPKSSGLSTFVQQFEVLYDNYRAAVRMIEDLKAKKEQHQ